MTRVDPSVWAKAIADDLYVGGERIPFERVLHQHLVEVDPLRSTGLTWHSLAQFLVSAGVRRPNAQPYSADHLRVCCMRLKTRANTKSVSISHKPHEMIARRANTSGKRSDFDKKPQQIVSQEPVFSTPRAPGLPIEDKDVSIEELAAVRARLQSFR